MRNSLLLCSLLIMFQSEPNIPKPTRPCVPDAKTAARVAYSVSAALYGEKIINAELPFKCILKDNVWMVVGAMPSKAKRMTGGTVTVKISRLDGRIIGIIHGK